VSFCQDYGLQRRAKRSSALRARAAELARADCKARKGGTKLRLATLFGHVLARCPGKADYFHKVTKAIWFSAAFRHISFGCRSPALAGRADKSSALAECA